MTDNAVSNPSTDHAGRLSKQQAINEMFGKFRLVFHNQYSKAFPNTEELNHARKLWYDNLKHLSAEQILTAADKAIRESTFLPTIKTILDRSYSMLGLPSAHDAYMEACNKPSPKAKQHWSHPAVYQAGKQTGWFFLNETIEDKAFPVFRQQYLSLCEQVSSGKQLAIEHETVTHEDSNTPLTNEQRKQKMKDMRKELGI